MSNTRIITVVSILFCLFLGYLFFTLFEYYEEEIDLGWRAEAQINPYLAAEFLGEKIGLNASSEDNFDKLEQLDLIDTLFISDSSQVLSERRLDELLLWLENGGHLIIAAKAPSDFNRDRVLDYFDITVQTTDYVSPSFEDLFSSDDFENSEERSDAFRQVLEQINEELKQQSVEEALSPEERITLYEEAIDNSEISLLAFDGLEEELRIRFNPGIHLSHPDFIYEEGADEDYVVESEVGSEAESANISEYELVYWQGSDYGVHFLQIEVGGGLLSIVSNADIFNSYNIDKFDHAYLWQVLINQGDDVTILHGINMPSLWQILKRYANEILISFCAFFCFWLWRNIRRFGIIKQSPELARRSMSEHISASANYLWRGGWQDTMLNHLITNINQRAALVLPGYSSSSNSQQMKKLSQATGIEEELIISAMQAEDTLSEDKFTLIVQLLQKIRKSL